MLEVPDSEPEQSEWTSRRWRWIAFREPRILSHRGHLNSLTPLLQPPTSELSGGRRERLLFLAIQMVRVDVINIISVHHTSPSVCRCCPSPKYIKSTLFEPLLCMCGYLFISKKIFAQIIFCRKMTKDNGMGTYAQLHLTIPYKGHFEYTIGQTWNN